ncbi:MAG: superoxide dismutase family protein [Pseudomonadota bacterium]
MNKLTLGAITAIIVGVVTAFAVANSDEGTKKVSEAKASLIDTEGRPLGEAIFRQGASGVVIQLMLESIPPGWHGVHLHKVGDCSDGAAGFKASGGHINPWGRKHGLLHPEGPDNADLPNLYAHTDGVAHASYFTQLVSLTEGGDLPGLLDGDGSALVIHANPDDMITQPIGGAGARIACGVVKAD